MTIVDGAVTDGIGLSVTAHPTPYDGENASGSVSLYTPIWSTSTRIYLCCPVTRGGVAQTRAARLSTSYAVEQDVQAGAQAHDTAAGHRWGAIAESDAGTVVLHPERHHESWVGEHATTVHDLTTLTATPTPLGTQFASSYRRFFRNPYTGALWLTVRGDDYRGRLYRWDDATSTWERRGGNPLTAENLDAAYGGELAFAPGWMYLTAEWHTPISGYPRRDGGLIRSSDDGATWLPMDSETPLAFPITSLTQTTIFPGMSVMSECIAVDIHGDPILVVAWQHPEEDYRSLWQARWSSATGAATLTRLIAHSPGRSVGNARLAYTGDGTVIVVVSEYDDHDPVTTAETSTPVGSRLWLLITEDDGAHWTRYVVDDSHRFSGAFIDEESVRRGGPLRILPCRSTDATFSQIWELTVPDAQSTVSAGAGWEVLRGIMRGIRAEQPAIREREAPATRPGCPACAGPLEANEAGVRWCPFDGWRSR
jgi:hypothetical protein